MKKTNAAVISSNMELLRFFELELLTLGFNVTAVQSLSEACDRYDFLIADIDTVSIVPSAYNCPVICVSATCKECENGTYFLPWPVSVHGIANCCYTVCDRSDGEHMNASDKNVLYAVDKREGIAVLDGRNVNLSQTEFKIIEALCRAEGKIVTREQIMEAIGADKGNISDVYICRLRKKLEGICGRKLIYTERSVGYRTVLRMAEK